MDTNEQTSSYQELLHFLKKPESYPYRVDEVQHIQTHISHVFIAEPFVYKLKKPVNFGFLDYSTLKKRRKYCRREVELNRRLSDDIYVGVTGFTRLDERQYLFVEDQTDTNTIREYAVKMRKLPEKYFMHRYIKEGRLKQKHIDRVADSLASFYLGQNQTPELSDWGTIGKVKINTDENFDQTEQFISRTIDRNSFDAIRYFTDFFFRQCKQLFERRIRDGRIVDGHGDLHLDHIHITPQKVQIYDCIEFNDRFRYGDLAADLAYLAMDLDFHNCRAESRYFIDRMSRKLDDKDLLQIIDFYKCYRAYVKGKVKSLQSAEEEVPEGDREHSAQLAGQYFNLSLQYALLGSEPTVIIFMGRVGTGKSTLANLMAEKLKIQHVASDRVRKSLAGLSLTKRTPESERDSLYAHDMTEKTYLTLKEKALESIQHGESVILDATFGNQKFRDIFTAHFEDESIEHLFIEVQATDETIMKRLQAREEKNDVISDARGEDFKMLTTGYDIPAEIDDRHFITLDTEQSPADSMGQLYKKLITLHLDK